MSAWLMIVTLVLPMTGGLVAYALGKRAAFVGSGFTFVAFILGVWMIVNGQMWSYKFEWLPGVELGWRVDQLALVLVVLVLFVSVLVHLFSIKYMHADEYPRYFAKLGFFTSAMLGLLMADHLILLFICWELVGFASYLLIGFYHKKEEAASSAKWAFVTNRVADVALLAAILTLGFQHSFFLSELSTIGSVWVAAGLLFGAMGKSAQLPFSAWLPRAMTGPTPVSALIHAATMVAAGVYLLLRVAPFFPDVVLTATAIVGVLTAFFGAFSAIAQHDLKQVLAYSTVSQLGFMFLGIGVGAFESAFFHLYTHAFFKAGLFLAAGVIIHHIGTQDMRHMGGLGNSMKWVMYVHIVCGLALAGIPLFSGFMSKEGILQAVWFWGEQKTDLGYSEAHLVSYFTFFTVFLTAWYIGRQVWLVYWTPSRAVSPVQPLAFDGYMGLPLVLLGIGSLWFVHQWSPMTSAGWVVSFVGYQLEAYPANLIPYVSSTLAFLGLVHCYGLFGPRRFYVQHYAELTYPPSITGRLSYFGWFLDDLYDKILAPVYVAMAVAMHWIDRMLIDRLVNVFGVFWVVVSKLVRMFDSYMIDGAVRALAWVSKQLGRLFTRIQSGQAQHQIAWLIVALILVVLFILF